MHRQSQDTHVREMGIYRKVISCFLFFCSLFRDNKSIIHTKPVLTILIILLFFSETSSVDQVRAV